MGEITASSTGGNGERLDVSVGSHHFGLQAKDLPVILLIILLGIIGYIRSQDIRDNQREVVALLQAQNMRLTDQNERLAQQTDDIRKMLEVLSHNFGVPPEHRLPLETPQIPGKSP